MFANTSKFVRCMKSLGLQEHEVSQLGDEQNKMRNGCSFIEQPPYQALKEAGLLTKKKVVHDKILVAKQV